MHDERSRVLREIRRMGKSDERPAAPADGGELGATKSESDALAPIGGMRRRSFVALAAAAGAALVGIPAAHLFTAARKRPPLLGGGLPTPSEFKAMYSDEFWSAFKTKFAQTFETVTPDNAWKWARLQPDGDTWNWTDTDEIMAWAKETGLKVKVHAPFASGWSMPEWVRKLSHDDALSAMKRNIEAIGKRYGDRVWLWDAINEPFHWRKTGPLTIEDAAAAVSAIRGVSTAGVIVNEYNLIHRPRELARACEFAKGIGADGIGLQTHSEHRYTRDLLRNAFDYVATTGLDLHLSEIIRPGKTEEEQAGAYEDVIAAGWKHRAVKSMSFWHLSDCWCWKEFPGTGLLKADLSEKPAYKLVAALRQ